MIINKSLWLIKYNTILQELYTLFRLKFKDQIKNVDLRKQRYFNDFCNLIFESSLVSLFDFIDD